MDGGVNDIQEVRFGYDGIVFASAPGPSFALTPTAVFNALAAKIVKDGKVVDNTNAAWNEADASLPSQPIAAFIPAENHGTREVFDQKVLDAGCKASGALEAFKAAGMDDKAAAAQCHQVRNDGKATDIAGDYTETLARIAAKPAGHGRVRPRLLRAEPGQAEGRDRRGRHPLGRHRRLGRVPGVASALLLREEGAYRRRSGPVGVRRLLPVRADDRPDGPLAQYGLVPAPDAQREEARQKFAAGTTIGG